MKDDIVDRLRNAAQEANNGIMSLTVRESLIWMAADEIEELRKIITSLEFKL